MVMMMEKELKCNLTMGATAVFDNRLPAEEQAGLGGGCGCCCCCCPAETLIPDQQHLTVPLHQPLAVSCFSPRGLRLHLPKGSAKDVKCFFALDDTPLTRSSSSSTFLSSSSVPPVLIAHPSSCWLTGHGHPHTSSCNKPNIDSDVYIWMVIKSLEGLMGELQKWAVIICWSVKEFGFCKGNELAGDEHVLIPD